MVYQQFGIHAKEPVKQSFVLYRHPGQLTHRVNTIDSQFLCYASAYTPELRDRLVVPQLMPIRHFIQFCDAYTVFVGRHLFGHNIHRHLAEIHIRTNASRSSNARLTQHVANHLHRQLMGSQFICAKISRHIHNHLIDGIHMDVLWCYILQINLVYLRADLNVVCHLRRCCYIVNSPVRMLFQFYIGCGFACQTMTRHLALTFIVHLAHPLYHLKQSCTSANTVCFQRG